jgi:8-amino-7-oxononanoate synthase
VFPTGYQTNIGVLTALAGPDDVIVSDALNHASIIDGCRLSRAQISVYPHGDSDAAARLLDEARTARRRLLVTESLFSMNGDSAPLARLADAARSHDAVFIVDEAHAVGVLGPRGRGLCAAAGVLPDVLIGTLGKALATSGGFAAGSQVLRDLLLNRARSFIFTTALPPPVAAAARAALEVVDSPEGDRRRTLLRAQSDHLARELTRLRPGGIAAALPATVAGSPIHPFVVGTETAALELSATLAHRQIFVPAIRPPTVPVGSARLRITLSAAHEATDLDRLVEALASHR